MRASRFAFFMNLPTIAFLCVVLVYPIVFAGYLSVHKVGLAQLRRGAMPISSACVVRAQTLRLASAIPLMRLSQHWSAVIWPVRHFWTSMLSWSVHGKCHGW